MNPIQGVFHSRGLSVASAPFSEVKIKPLEGARTVFITALPYYFEALPNQNLARFAALPDYHRYFGDILQEICKELTEVFPGNWFKPFTDNSPIDEQKAALLSGFAIKGKNNLCITENGSFVFLGEVITDGNFECSTVPPHSFCDTCNLCVKACPGGALSEKGFDYRKCLAYLTQKKGELSDEEQVAIRKNGLAWGCDRCSEVCPRNQSLPTASIALPPNEILPRLDISDIQQLTDREFREIYKDRAFAWRGKGTMLRNLYILEGQNYGKT